MSIKKTILLLVLLLLSYTPINAIQINNNSKIDIGLTFVSKYIYRGTCVTYENFQYYSDFCFGNDSTMGIFSIKPWISIGHDTKKQLYLETDATLSYTTPYKYFIAELRYVYYISMFDKKHNHKLQIATLVNLQKYIPLSIIAETTFLNKDYLFDTNLLLNYNYAYKNWNLRPSIGFRFGSLSPYGYIELDARRNINLSQKTNMFLKLSANINSYDISNFSYQKNFNGWLTCGFLF